MLDDLQNSNKNIMNVKSEHDEAIQKIKFLQFSHHCNVFISVDRHSI